MRDIFEELRWCVAKYLMKGLNAMQAVRLTQGFSRFRSGFFSLSAVEVWGWTLLCGGVGGEGLSWAL